ncbi:MAG: hypothetical protein M5U28_53525 [Sandaracinaceae bacterium]|nr:hypothetical protein [Sandaracinaceae bacterium]
MDVRFVLPDLRRIDELKSEALALVFFEDERPLRAGRSAWWTGGSAGSSRACSCAGARGARSARPCWCRRGRAPLREAVLVRRGASRGARRGSLRGGARARARDLRSRPGSRASVVGLPARGDRIAPERAMQIFLALAAAHPEQDQVTLIEDAEAQRAMAPVVERERRRVRAEVE